MPLQITQDLGAWAYILLAVIAMVEGPVVTLAAAVAAAAGLMSPGWVFVSASAGNLIGDGLWYALGYMGKTEWLERYGRWFGFSESLIQRIMNDARHHAGKLLFIAKITLGFVIPTLIAAGLLRVHPRRWITPYVLAEFLWTGSLVGLGFFFGRYVQTFEQGVQWASMIGGILFAGFSLYYLARVRQRSALAKTGKATPTKG